MSLPSFSSIFPEFANRNPQPSPLRNEQLVNKNQELIAKINYISHLLTQRDFRINYLENRIKELENNNRIRKQGEEDNTEQDSSEKEIIIRSQHLPWKQRFQSGRGRSTHANYGRIASLLAIHSKGLIKKDIQDQLNIENIDKYLTVLNEEDIIEWNKKHNHGLWTLKPHVFPKR